MPAHFNADDHLPLTAPMFEVLLALADGDKHGYAIIKEVRSRTDGRVRLSAGTLYGILKRFIDAGLIAECDERPDPALDDERRRYYRLTPHGRAVAVAETHRMEAAVHQARSKQLIKKPRTS